MLILFNAMLVLFNALLLLVMYFLGMDFSIPGPGQIPRLGQMPRRFAAGFLYSQVLKLWRCYFHPKSVVLLYAMLW